MSEAILGKGTTISHSELGGTDLTELAEVFSVGYPSVESSDVKVTHYGTSGDMHEYIPGWKEGGTVQVQMNYTPAQQAELHTLQGVAKLWTITLPDTSTIAFEGYIKSVGAEIPNEDKITGSCTIKVTSEPSFTPVA